ncbi:Fe-S cluster assembly protein IscX, partial [Pseudomonas allii]
AILLADANPDLDPYSLNFVALRDMVMALPGFEDERDRGGEKVLEAIQTAWKEEQD